MLTRHLSRSGVLSFAAGACCSLALVSAGAAQTPVMIDVNPYSTSTADASPANFARIGNAVLFAANDGSAGTELWISDGTGPGTMLLADINPGASSSSPQNLTAFGSRVIFTADNGVLGRELWITDGTPGGTTLLRDINPSGGTTGFSGVLGAIGTFGSAGAAVVFAANDGTNGTELWVTDGTPGGTTLLLDIRTGSASSIPSGFFVSGGRAYFLANDGGGALFGNELWSTDGTLANTTRLTDIAAGAASSGYSIDAVRNGWGYGAANNAAAGNDMEPTAINLTTLEVRRLADIRPGATGSSSQEFVVAGGDLFFRASAAGTDTQLYKVTYDGLGDPVGVTLVTDINASGNDNVGNLAAFGGLVYFAASDGVGGRELWRSDGTPVGTTMVADLNAGAGDSTPLSPLVIGSRLFFTATTAATGRELYVTDGTGGGTVLVANLRAGAANGLATAPAMAELGGNLVFAGIGTAVGNELHGSDGTPAGTGLVKDIRPQAGNTGSQPQTLVAAGGRVYFTATDEAAGRELWATDGTAAGTVRVVDATPGGTGGSPSTLTPFSGGSLLFVANGGTGAGQTGIEYYRVDGTAASLLADINPGTGSSAPGGTPTIGVLGSSAYFSATDGSSGAELWRYDGTNAPTRVADFVPGTGGLSPANITAIDGFVYFAGTTSGAGGFGNEPYRSDGTTISLLEDFNTGTTNSSFPAGFFGFGGNVFMRATAASSVGSELVVYDAQLPDVVLVQDIRPGSSSSSPSNFVNFNGQLLFTAADSLGNLQLFTASAAAGSAVAKSNAIGTTATSLVRSGDYVFFAAGTGVGTNVELWAYDGVANGGNAFVVAEINTAGGSFPTDLTDVNGVLYFGAVGDTGGNELHRVTFDGFGVPNGAQQVADLNPAGSSTPTGLRFANNKLHFAADNGSSGVELWVINFCRADFNGSGAVTVQDIFDFLAAYFSNSAAADVNGSGSVTVQDIFDFLGAYFAGCA